MRFRFPLVSTFAVAALACAGDTVPYEGPHQGAVRRSMRSIERATGRKFLTSPKLEERSRDEVRAFLESAFEEQISPLELAGMETAYKRFGLIPDTMDLRAVFINLLSEQVIGYYSPANDVLYVVRDGRPDLVRATITHELVHALQDQHFPLDSAERIRNSNDRRTAAQAAIEGHATWEGLVVESGLSNFLNAVPGGWDGIRRAIRDEQETMPLLVAAPIILRETLIFPYLSGAEHIKALKERTMSTWPFDSLPESTEQVLNHDKYFGQRDHPTTVTLPAPRAGTAAYDSDLGELEARMFLYQHSRDLDVSSRAAAGWDGDRYMVVSLPGDRDGLVWATVWDSALDAAEWVDALELVLPKRYKGLKRVTANTSVRRFEGAGRTVEVRVVTRSGRPVVLFTDVPAGVAAGLVDPERIQLSPEV